MFDAEELIIETLFERVKKAAQLETIIKYYHNLKHDIMKTLEKIRFPKLENDYLENILRQLVNRYTIIQMFFTRQDSSLFSYLVIHVEDNIDAHNLQCSKWVRKVKDKFHVNISFICSSKLHHQYYSLGSPFVAFYCRKSAVIYQNNQLENSVLIALEWKKYKKRFNKYVNIFYHDHDIYMSQIKSLISEGSSNSVYTSYARLIEYILSYLEEMYLGNNSTYLGIDEKINNLIEFVPDIQKYFVRTSHNRFYLTDLFLKAREASADNDIIYKEEMFESVEIAQRSLYRLLENRFTEFKKLIKKGLFVSNEAICLVEDKTKDMVLDNAIKTLLESAEVEEIYLYHKVAYDRKMTYYLLFVAKGMSNEKLNWITKSLKSKAGEKYDFVLLCHSRLWIQTNLYQNQSFFSRIIQREYLIYSSNKYLPEFHWEIPHNPYHADLYFYYQSTKDTYLQFFTIVNNVKGNYQGLEYFFALFFISFCRTYIFIKTFYLPNYLSSQILWQLCLYADSEIHKYNYLIETFWTNFFPYLDKNRTLHHKLSKFNKEEVDQMCIIVEKLMDELRKLVIGNGLLMSFEKD